MPRRNRDDNAGLQIAGKEKRKFYETEKVLN